VGWLNITEILTQDEQAELLAEAGRTEQKEPVDMTVLLAEMGRLDTAGRPDFFNRRVLPELACTDPVNRDVAVNEAAKLLKPCGVTRQTIRRAVKLSMPEDVEGGEDTGEKEERKSQADILIKLAEAATLFHDDLQEPFSLVEVNGHTEVWPVRSRFFRRWLIGQFYKMTSKAPNGDAISQAMGVIEAKACFDGPEHKLSLRVAEHNGAFWYDLADAGWRAVKITPEGWQVVDSPPVLFRRYKNTAPQVEPRRAKNSLLRLLDFANLRNEEEQILLLVYVVTCLVPGIPHVIPPFHGEKGAAKSTVLRVLRRVVDPAYRELLTIPKEQSEFALMLSHNYMPAFDNLDGLQPWQSDMLCCAATGGGISKRELYTDEDEIILSFLRCPTLNGINLVATRPDFLDRSLLFELTRINPAGRREEAEFWEAFEEARPAIVGGMFDALAGAMRVYPKVKLTGLPRMADFCRWGYAAAEATGTGGEIFLRAYLENIGKANEEAITGSPVATAIVALMRGLPYWEGTAGGLLEALEKVAETEKINTRAKSWPKAANSLSRRLLQVKSNLMDAGIEMVVGEDAHAKNKIFVLRKSAESISATSATSANPYGTRLTACGDTAEILAAEKIPPQRKPSNGAVCGAFGACGDSGGIFPTLSEEEKNNFKAKSAGGGLNGVDDIPF
jgi:hypothetical protein